MKTDALTHATLAAAAVFSVGVLAGCAHCQPLLPASVICLVVERWLASANQGTRYENVAS